jgi:large subunit ribosomal protein L21
MLMPCRVYTRFDALTSDAVNSRPLFRGAIMYAIIKTGGKQYRVAPGEKIKVEQISAEVGAALELGEVLFHSDGTNVKTGSPLIDGAKVKATVVGHGRGDKVKVFKMRRRKNYRRTQGHRQNYTEIRIDSIG